MITYIYPDGKQQKKPNRKFSCDELKRFFNGNWFTLQCVFTKNNDTETTMEYYMCCLDPFMYKGKLPELNEPIKKMFNR